ncbi:MAG: hypothetical protein HYY40_01195 [Bacteroidetes bacterium]|nr:hypothetical protein [Bacteroidota bacterium]
MPPAIVTFAVPLQTPAAVAFETTFAAAVPPGVLITATDPVMVHPFESVTVIL